MLICCLICFGVCDLSEPIRCHSSLPASLIETWSVDLIWLISADLLFDLFWRVWLKRTDKVSFKSSCFFDWNVMFTKVASMDKIELIHMAVVFAFLLRSVGFCKLSSKVVLKAEHSSEYYNSYKSFNLTKPHSWTGKWVLFLLKFFLHQNHMIVNIIKLYGLPYKWKVSRQAFVRVKFNFRKTLKNKEIRSNGLWF